MIRKFNLVLLLSLLAFSMTSIVNADWSGANGAACTASCIDFKRTWTRYDGSKNASTPIKMYALDGSGGTVIKDSTLGEFTNKLVKIGFWTKSEETAFYASKNAWLMSDPNGVLYNLDANPRDEDVFQGLSKEQSKALIQYMKSVKQGWGTTGMAVFGVDDFIQQDEFLKNDDDGNGNIACYVGSGPKEKKEHTNTVDVTVTGDYSVFIKITPVKPSNFDKLSDEEKEEWANTHKEQTIGPVYTELGKFIKENKSRLDEINGDPQSREKWKVLAEELEQAKKAGYSFDNIDLSPENLAGFQRGGAYTVTTLAKTATISAKNKSDQIQEYSCVTKTVDTPLRVSKTYYEQTGTREDYFRTEEPKFTINSEGYSPRKSYQIINVKCNETEFHKLVNRTKSSITTAGSGLASSSAVSPTIHNEVATFYNELSVDFFYNGKDCANKLRCSAIPNTNADNDSSNNIQDRGDNQSKFGAQSDGKSSDVFSFFRDNKGYQVRNDVWYPDLNDYANDFAFNPKLSAKATFITLDPKGTPKEELFNLKDSEGNILISGIDLAAGNNAIVNNSQINTLVWEASYSSEKNLEHKANVSYAYQANVKVAVPKLNSDGIVSNEVFESEFLDIICDSTYNSTDSKTPKIQNSPKTGNYKPNKDFDETAGKYYKVGFVKSSAE